MKGKALLSSMDSISIKKGNKWINKTLHSPTQYDIDTVLPDAIEGGLSLPLLELMYEEYFPSDQHVTRGFSVSCFSLLNGLFLAKINL